MPQVIQEVQTLLGEEAQGLDADTMLTLSSILKMMKSDRNNQAWPQSQQEKDYARKELLTVLNFM